MRAIGIIPARYESRRFPGKPLADIHGTTLIQRVYDQAKKCSVLDEVVVATDDKRILDHVLRFGKAVMTNPDHPSGTDRCLEAYELLNSNKRFNDNDLLVNIQGDQPFIAPEQIAVVVEAFKHQDVSIATLATSIKNQEDMKQSDVVKVVCDKNGRALYFSRSPIPFCRNKDSYGSVALPGMKHIGIYGFRISTLKQLCRLPLGNLEQSEGLEQLRWLENGFKVWVKATAIDRISIDRRENIFQSGETS